MGVRSPYAKILSSIARTARREGSMEVSSQHWPRTKEQRALAPEMLVLLGLRAGQAKARRLWPMVNKAQKLCKTL